MRRSFQQFDNIVRKLSIYPFSFDSFRWRPLSYDCWQGNPRRLIGWTIVVKIEAPRLLGKEVRRQRSFPANASFAGNRVIY